MIGCGVASGDGSNGGRRGTVVNCQYSPPGNYVGAYKNRVQPPKPGVSAYEQWETVSAYVDEQCKSTC